MTNQTLIEEMRSVHLLSALSHEQLARVASHATHVKLDAGQLLFSQGDPANRFFLVLEGQIRLFRVSREGAEKIIEIVTPRQTFAEALTFLNAPRYPVCAGSLSPAEVIAIDGRDFALMIRESVETCCVLLCAMSQRLHGLLGEIESLTLHNATSRYARYLLTSLRENGRVLDLDVPKMVIASRISITPETFSRIEKRLSKLGIIEVHRSHVTINDHEALAKIAKLNDYLELSPMPCIHATERMADDLDTE